MRRLHSLTSAVGLGLAVVSLSLGAADRLAWLGPAEHIAEGVDLFQTTDTTLVESTGPIAVSLLRLDPSHVKVATALAKPGDVQGADTVTHIAATHGAIAAVNGGLFNAGNSEPVGILQVGGELISDNAAPEGVAAIRAPDRGHTVLDFDLVSVAEAMSFGPTGHRRVVPIDGVDTTRARGRLMLYTPQFHADTDTAPSGTEWRIDGSPLRVVEIRARQGRTAIPRSGVVLSYGGTDLPADLAALSVGTTVELHRNWTSRFGLPAATLDGAHSVLGGAGLLRSYGRVPPDWSGVDHLGQLFTKARHPRTMLGADAHGTIWIATVDGRDASRSVGMTFADLERLCDRLGLTGALNLDGGGSTTMVVKGRVVNRPADGEKPVNNALVVTLR